MIYHSQEKGENMSIYEKYFVRGGACPQMHFPCIPSDAVKTSVCIDKSVVPEGIFGCVEWIVKDFVTEGLVAHNTGELHMFVGGDPKDYENLNAEIDFQLENDHFVFSENSFIFVPEGCAHNIVSVKGLKKPMLHYIMQIDASEYKAIPAAATAEPGKYADHRVIKYERTDGQESTPPPPGFLTFLLWIDGRKVPNAPYTESVWFHTSNDTGPENHIHANMDEFVAFIGSDPEHPEELNGDISMTLGDAVVHTTKSTIVFIPRNVSHCPLLVHRVDRDILHFSGGNGGSYIRGPIEE